MVVPALNLPPVPDAAPDVDQRVILSNVDFQTYSTLRDLLDGPSPRLTYLCGTLEIMSPSRRHEDLKKRIARLVELFALVRDIPLYSYGSTTFRREVKQRALEPDECYCVGSDMLEFPEIALEIVVTHGGINKLAVYREFGVREVWFWKDERFELYALRDDGFHALSRSERIPALDFVALAGFVQHADQHQAVLEYRAFLRAGASAT